METEKISCFKCQHFYITWDKNHPNGCKAFGFKAKQMPSTIVQQADGNGCLAFKAKG